MVWVFGVLSAPYRTPCSSEDSRCYRYYLQGPAHHLLEQAKKRKRKQIMLALAPLIPLAVLIYFLITQ